MQLHIKAFAATFVLLASLGSSPLLAQDRVMGGDGIWLYQGSTETTNGDCQRQWTCTLSGGIGYREGESLEFSVDTSTAGTCSDNGAGDSTCRVCTASEPVGACTWAIVPAE